MTTTLLALRGVMSVTGLALLALAVWIHRTRDAPSLWPFVGLTAVVGSLAVADGFAAGNATTLSLVWLVAYVTIPTAFTWFVVEYYGLPHLGSWPRKVAFLAPAVVGIAGGSYVLVALSPAASAMVPGGFPESASLLLSTAKFGEQIALYYGGGVMLAGVALLVRTVAAYDYLDGRLAVVLSFVPVWPWVAYLVTPGIVEAVGTVGVLTMTTSGYVLSGLAAVFAVTVGGLFDAAPAAGTLGPETVLADLDDAVVVVDHEERVVRANAAAVDTFGLDATAVTGTALVSAVGVDLATLKSADSVELDLPGGSRHFEARVSPIRDRLDRQPGHAIVISDVTQERVRAQRLTVLHRVLRHNLRNEMSTIMGRAEVIATEDNEYTDTAEAILDSADDLVDVGERAREVETMMSTGVTAEETVELATLTARVVEDYRTQYPDATLSVDVEDSLTVPVDGHVLSRVLDNLVENALEHNDAPTPVVTVTARVTDDGTAVRLSVVDNGPGLPEQERTVIEAGTESPLEHGSGLGLWAVKWGVIRMGGDLSFNENEPDGTVVTVRLPRGTAVETSEPVSVQAN